ncbi:MAG: HD domain-containing protein, partial [Synergistota bacterium]|nr:HD domain-containing protein [Synergistota bacterium]
IKPPVFHRLMQDTEQRRKLNEWVVSALSFDLESLSPDFASRFREYIFAADDSSLERKSLRAAHYLATKWEFDFVYHWSKTKSMYGIEHTNAEISRQINEHRDLRAIDEILAARDLADRDKGLWGFLSLVGQLGFQKRWAQTPRIPQTSVLGHLLFVAVMAYFISLEIGACPRRRYNNFFGGLFHDLPEVLTRDIVAPVKKSVTGLDELVKQLEKQSMEERLLPLLPEAWRSEIHYFTEDEFAAKIRPPGASEPVILDGDLCSEHNSDSLDPLDGHILEACDKLAAYIEASLSMRMGVAPQALADAKRNLYSRFHRSVVSGYPVGRLFDYFW